MSELASDINTALAAAQFSPVAKMCAAVRPFQMRQAKLSELAAAHNVCRNMIAGELVSVETMARVEIWTGRTFFLRFDGGAPSAVMAIVCLSGAGAAALNDGVMGADIKDPDWVARLDEDAAATLVWAVAGETSKDQSAVIRGMLAVWRDVYPHIPTYGRASTPQGMQLMGRLGFKPVLSRPGRGQLFSAPRWPGAVTPRRVYQQVAFSHAAAGGVSS